MSADRVIGIVGAGAMGQAIAQRFAVAGQTVLLTDDTPAKAAEAASRAQPGASSTVRAASVQQALAADIVVLAIWYPGTVDFARTHNEALASKIVIDIANPLDDTYTDVTTAPDTSAAEHLAHALPSSTIVKAFNTVPGPTLSAGEIAGTGLDTFIASDDDHAKQMVMTALSGSGLRALDAGKLANARLLERLCAFGIELGQRYGIGFSFGIKYLPDMDFGGTGTHGS